MTARIFSKALNRDSQTHGRDSSLGHDSHLKGRERLKQSNLQPRVFNNLIFPQK
jgi:hypothetical protein